MSDDDIKEIIRKCGNTLLENFYEESNLVRSTAINLVDAIVTEFQDNRIGINERQIEPIVMEQINYINNMRRKYQVGLEDTVTRLNVIGNAAIDGDIESNQVSRKFEEENSSLRSYDNNITDLLYEVYPVIQRKLDGYVSDDVMDEVRGIVLRFQGKFEEDIMGYRNMNSNAIQRLKEEVYDYVVSKERAASRIDSLDNIIPEQINLNNDSKNKSIQEFTSMFYKEFIDLTRNIVGKVNGFQNLNLDEVHNLYSKFVAQILPTFTGDIDQFYQLVNSDFVPEIVSITKQVVSDDSVKLSGNKKTESRVLDFSDKYDVINTERVFDDVKNIVFSQYSISENDPRFNSIISEIEQKKKTVHDISYEKEKQILVENVASIEEKSNSKLEPKVTTSLADFFY